MYYDLEIDENLVKLAEEVEEELSPIFKEFDRLCMKNSSKILKAFHNANLASSDFAEVNGYGFYDCGRDKLEFEKVYVLINEIFGDTDIQVCIFGDYSNDPEYDVEYLGFLLKDMN